MAYYVEPNSTDTRGFYEFFNYVNTVADGLFFPVIMWVIWLIIFLATKQYSTSRAWTIASFISAFLSIPLAVMGLIAPRLMYMFVIFAAGGIVWLKLEQ